MLGKEFGKESEENIILLTDSYKCSHYSQYPENTTKIYSYFESRGGKFSEVCFYGLQIFIKKYLTGKVVTREKIDEAEELLNLHFGPSFEFPRHLWEHILTKHDGHLPIKIKAVPEGLCVPTKNVLFTMENTDKECFWLTNYLETILVQVWYPMTVATNSREQKKIILENLIETGDESTIGFKLHDFGYRGVSSNETAGIGASAHLTQFLGTDTIAGLITCRRYYSDPEKKTFCPGFSIPASEHSTITSWGRDGEEDAYGNMLKKYPSGLVACVSDSWDIIAAVKIWGTKFRDEIMSREGTLVVRPDSGDPPTIIMSILNELEKYFPVKVNEKGYKVLDEHIRVIQGDGIDYEMIKKILEVMKKAGWSGDNIAFGSGGGLLQKLNRDTMKCAFKCSMAAVDGSERYVYKDPVTDFSKKSKKGYLKLVREDNSYKTVSSEIGEDLSKFFEDDVLQTVFENGKLHIDYEFEEIRNRSEIIL
jgi:nicotinamide phosphoribosyltransferase